LEWWGVSGVEEKDMHESLCRYNQVGPMFQLFAELPNWLFPKKPVVLWKKKHRVLCYVLNDG